ncbi:MAG: asparagine synthase (glutamine-hydrolyzing) [Bacteroidales bacterium]|jgi:asparagine synthase (glutamine-hydrolysing)|nr:asparagine synthase (glutamine-hydrolyzing) [Bacteroidales bacterium]
MCGITGYFSKENNNFVNQKTLDEMTLSLKHRGDDARGIFFTENCGLGHQRLSIIDLSIDANQPMESHSLRYIGVFNGEIYNYKEITKDLNLVPYTNSDTEIVIEAFANWGRNFINKLNGMFAIAIFDKQEKKLFLFRDRAGVKPLFYYWDGINFAFASEIKSLLKIKYIQKNNKINKAAIQQFLHLGFIPEPNTIYNNIHKFPSGSFAVISEIEFKIEPYWNIEENIKSNVISDFSQAKEKLSYLIEDAVKIRLDNCDVDFGTFLSGGIDSSLITAIANKNKKTKKLNTFSIGFKNSNFDESKYAEKVAGYLGTNHKTFIISQDEVRDIIEEVFDFFDEPFADSSAIPTMILSKHTKEDVSMVLSGDGGDELFHGYGSYIWAKRLSYFHTPYIRKYMNFSLKHFPSNKFKRAATLFEFSDKNTLKSHILSQEEYLFSNNEIENILKPNFNNYNYSINQNFDNFNRNLTPAEEQAVFDLRYYLKDDLLVKVDRSSMKYALEVRVPLLDYRIIEFTLNIAPSLKIKHGTQKLLLKQILYDFIPENFFNRPKHGFSIPLSEWLLTDKYISDLINKYLNKKTIEKFGLVEYSEVETLITKFKNGHDYLYNRIWALILLHKFFSNKNLL